MISLSIARPVEVAAGDVAGLEPVATGTDPATAKLRGGLEAKLARARKLLARAQSYRTFATEVVDFLERLRTRNTTFSAGAYPRGEVSVDVFLNAGEHKQGSFRVEATETFFDRLNDTALEGGSWGTFRWRADDDRMMARIAPSTAHAGAPRPRTTAPRPTSCSSTSTCDPTTSNRTP